MNPVKNVLGSYTPTMYVRTPGFGEPYVVSFAFTMPLGYNFLPVSLRTRFAGQLAAVAVPSVEREVSVPVVANVATLNEVV
jgi:hypothetical protein